MLATEETKKYIPIENIHDIYLFGEVDVTKRFLEFLSQKEVCMHYFNRYGYYMGTFYPREHYNSGHVTLKQAEHYLQEEKRLQLAKTFIEGAFYQMIRVLKYYATREKETKASLQQLITTLEEKQKDVMEKTSVQEMMGIEGYGRETYYQAFDLIIKNPDFPFEKRTKRPPKNRVNALISFGNSICYTMVLSEIYKTYLDPKIGYLHSTNFRRFSLNLDIAEIFKPIMVDRLIFSLLNKRILTKKDFDQHVQSILLTDEGRKKFIEALDKRMRQTVTHRHLGRSVSYRRLIRLEIYKLQKHILGEESYEPYKALW